MNDSTHPRSNHRNEWGPEEVALAEELAGGFDIAPERLLPDPATIFLLAQALGTETPRRGLAARVLLSWTFLTVVGILPITTWFVYLWRDRVGDLSALWQPSTLIALGKALTEAGAPGWEAGTVFFCVFLYLTYENLLTPPQRI
jgi:hypothetical protein